MLARNVRIPLIAVVVSLALGVAGCRCCEEGAEGHGGPSGGSLGPATVHMSGLAAFVEKDGVDKLSARFELRGICVPVKPLEDVRIASIDIYGSEGFVAKPNKLLRHHVPADPKNLEFRILPEHWKSTELKELQLAKTVDAYSLRVVFNLALGESPNTTPVSKYLRVPWVQVSHAVNLQPQGGQVPGDVITTLDATATFYCSSRRVLYDVHVVCQRDITKLDLFASTAAVDPTTLPPIYSPDVSGTDVEWSGEGIGATYDGRSPTYKLAATAVEATGTSSKYGTFSDILKYDGVMIQMLVEDE